MRRLLAALMLCSALTACGRAPERGQPSSSGSSADRSAASPAAESRAPGAGPDISPTAAPGVAFRYDYAFRLPDERIAEVQERHAQMCEGLGVQRCRVTGMTYRLVEDEHVEAMLQFALEPSIARRFGRAGLEAVQQADGLLVSSEISGEDVGTGIAANDRTLAQLREDLQRIERQVADRNVAEGEKDGLRTQAEDLRQRIRMVEEDRRAQQQTLATTPMTFRYGSGGFGSNRPDFGRAFAQAWTSLQWTLYGLILAVALLLPWLLLAAVGLWAFRRVRRRFGLSAASAPAEPTPAG